MALVVELQHAAADPGTKVSAVLRLAKVAAIRLHQLDSVAWIDAELFGYKGSTEVPGYRVCRGALEFWNPVHRLWCPVVNYSSMRFHCINPMDSLESLLESREPSFAVPASQRLTETVLTQIGFASRVVVRVSASSISGVVGHVRTLILDWALRLEAKGIMGENKMFKPEEVSTPQNVSNISVGAIHGNAIGLGATGSGTVFNTITMDAGSLANEALKLLEDVSLAAPALKLTPTQVRDLDGASRQIRDQSLGKPDKGRTKAALGSLKAVLEGAAGNVAAAGFLAEIAKLLGT